MSLTFNVLNTFTQKALVGNPLVEDYDTIMYQMNGFILATWLQSALEEDMQLTDLTSRSPFSLAHSVGSPEEVQALLNQLSTAGGHILRHADAPPHGGLRGYIADPDSHAWEIIWSSSLHVNREGWVSLASQA